MGFRWLQSDEINENSNWCSSYYMLCAYTQFRIQKILHCNKTSEQSGFQYYDDDSESEENEENDYYSDIDSEFSDTSEFNEDNSNEDSESKNISEGFNTIGDYADLIKKVTKICGEINRSSLQKEYLDKKLYSCNKTRWTSYSKC